MNGSFLGTLERKVESLDRFSRKEEEGVVDVRPIKFRVFLEFDACLAPVLSEYGVMFSTRVGRYSYVQTISCAILRGLQMVE